MKPHVRASVAAIALSHASGRAISSIYSYSGDGHMSITANVSGQNVNAYDYTTGSSISGSLSNIHHYGESSSISLTASGNGSYSGHDYGTGSAFTVRVNGGSVEIYDYGEGSHFSYSG